MINVSERLFADQTVRIGSYSEVNFKIFCSLINSTGPLITSLSNDFHGFDIADILTFAACKGQCLAFEISAMHVVNIFDKRDYLLYFCNKKDMADVDRIVGSNIRQFRERLSMSQQELADFLGVTSPLVSYYEGGGRSVPMLTIEKLASLFGVDAYDLFEENASLHTANTAFAFRADDLLNTDLEQIAQFRKIVKNYVSMKSLVQTNETEKGESSGS